MTGLQFDEAQLRTIVAGAVMQTLTADQQKTLISTAIETLITPKKADSYPYNVLPTGLQEAFNSACREMAREVISDKLDRDSEFREMLTGVINEAFQKLFLATGARETLISRMTNALLSAMTER